MPAPPLLSTDATAAPPALAGDVTATPPTLAGDSSAILGPCDCCAGCPDFSNRVCFALSSADCANLNGLNLNGVESSAGLSCRHWNYAGGSVTAGGCTFAVNVDFYCGCADGAAPCPASADFPTCAYVTVSGVNNCSPAGSPSWRLVTAPDGTDDKLPVAWVSRSPPVGTATGYVVPAAGTDPDCACPCPKNTRVDLVVTDGPCPANPLDCSCIPSIVRVTVQNIDGCACYDGLSVLFTKGHDSICDPWSGTIFTPACTPPPGFGIFGGIDGGFNCITELATFACGGPANVLGFGVDLDTSLLETASLHNYDVNAFPPFPLRPSNARVVSFNCSPLEIVIEGTFEASSDWGGNFADATYFGCTNPRPRVRFIITEP